MLSRPGNHATASEETTMRHALVPVQLLQRARAAIDAEPDEPTIRQARRTRRLATLTRRARG
jgi:hypothetical protein